MQYETMKSNEIDFTFESKNFSSIFGLYLFSLGAVISGYSLYLLLEVLGQVDRKIISWNGEGLFWFLILFFAGIFVLFIPVEFLTTFKVFNASFKDLIFNIVYSIVISLVFLIIFQYSIPSGSLIMNDISLIGKAVSFAGFVAVPVILFIQHTLRNKISLLENVSYSFTLFVWVLSSQLFL